jgi:hypothetical protein
MEFVAVQRVYEQEQFNIRKPENASIVFHHFSGDWARPTKNGDKGI